MALNESQQILELLEKSKKTLIIANDNRPGDAVGAALALAGFLTALGRDTEIVCPDFHPQANLKFLPQQQLKSKLASGGQFVISVDLTASGLKKFHYEQQAGRLDFYLTPEAAHFDERAVACYAAPFAYDLIIIIGASDLSELKGLYFDQADFFHATPKINIDFSPANEHFGDINLVNVTACSCAEIVYNLIRQINTGIISAELATYLLYGVIAATKNFKTGNVSPKTLNLAADLIGYGAARDQIVRELYQNRFLATLKLWGRVLSRLNNHLNDRIISSALSAADFLETGTSPDELPDVVEELIVSMPKTEVIVLLHEQSNAEKIAIRADIYALKNHNALVLAARFNPQGHERLAQVVISDGATLPLAEKMILDEIKNQLAGS